MKMLLDIPEDKVPFVLELLRGFPFLKTEPLSPENSNIISDLKEAVTEMNSIKKGRSKSVPLRDFLNEL